jgi:hypothetical protein
VPLVARMLRSDVNDGEIEELLEGSKSRPASTKGDEVACQP